MSLLLLPFQLVLLMFAGWVNRHHLDVIDYLHEENGIAAAPERGTRIPSSVSTTTQPIAWAISPAFQAWETKKRS